jgi:hypothetical protein
MNIFFPGYTLFIVLEEQPFLEVKKYSRLTNTLARFLQSLTMSVIIHGFNI